RTDRALAATEAQAAARHSGATDVPERADSRVRHRIPAMVAAQAAVCAHWHAASRAADRRDAPAPARTPQDRTAAPHTAAADIAASGDAAPIAAGLSHWRGPLRTDRSGRSGAPVPPADRSRPSGHADLCRGHSHHGREKVGPDIDQPSATMHPLQEGAKSYFKRMVTRQ